MRVHCYVSLCVISMIACRQATPEGGLFVETQPTGDQLVVKTPLCDRATHADTIAKWHVESWGPAQHVSFPGFGGSYRMTPVTLRPIDVRKGTVPAPRMIFFGGEVTSLVIPDLGPLAVAGMNVDAWGLSRVTA